MTSFRVLVTGSRTWQKMETIRQAFDYAESLNVHGFRTTLIHGGAAGADTMADMLAKHRGWEIEEYPAQWDIHTTEGKMPCPAWHWEQALDKCKMAGHRRNQAMVDKGADVCLAFIRDFSKGATGCADRAQAAHIPTRVWRENG